MTGIIAALAGMGGLLPSAKFIGVSVGATVGNVALPAGTAVGDYVFAMQPHDGNISGGGTGAWTTDTYVDKHGYTKRCVHKRLNSLAAVTFTGSYGPCIVVVYRGPTYCRLISKPENDTTILPIMHPVGRLSKTLGWMSAFNDRSGDGSGTPPTGWTKRTGPNANGVFTGELADFLNVGAMPTDTYSANWTGISATSAYFQSGWFYDMTSYANAAEYDAAYTTALNAKMAAAFFQPQVEKVTYSTNGSMPVLGATAFDMTQNNIGFRGSNPGKTIWICEIDAGVMAANGGVIGFCNDAWIQAWKNAYPNTVPGIGGGVFWTSTPGAGYSYLGSSTNGNETGTTVTGYASIQPNAGQVVGLVCSGKTLRMYLNGVLKGVWTLSGQAALPTYPMVATWGGRMQGAFRSTPSSYLNSYSFA